MDWGLCLENTFLQLFPLDFLLLNPGIKVNPLVSDHYPLIKNEMWRKTFLFAGQEKFQGLRTVLSNWIDGMHIFLTESSSSIKKSIIFSDVLAFPLSLMYHIIQPTFYDWGRRNVYFQIMLTHQTQKIWRKNHIFQQQESIKDDKTQNECFRKCKNARSILWKVLWRNCVFYVFLLPSKITHFPPFLKNLD